MSIILWAFLLKAVIFVTCGIGAIYACEEKWEKSYKYLGTSCVLVIFGFMFFGI